MKLDQTSAIGILEEIRRLQADRQKHVAALQRIDEVLRKIAATLGQSVPAVEQAGTRKAAQGRGVAAQNASADAGRRKYHKLPQTGEEFIVGYVRERGTATTLEINAAWRGQGRGGVANNALGRLVKQGLLAREPLDDQRGSRYRLTKRASGHAA